MRCGLLLIQDSRSQASSTRNDTCDLSCPFFSDLKSRSHLSYLLSVFLASAPSAPIILLAHFSACLLCLRSHSAASAHFRTSPLAHHHLVTCIHRAFFHHRPALPAKPRKKRSTSHTPSHLRFEHTQRRPVGYTRCHQSGLCILAGCYSSLADPFRTCDTLWLCATVELRFIRLETLRPPRFRPCTECQGRPRSCSVSRFSSPRFDQPTSASQTTRAIRHSTASYRHRNRIDAAKACAAQSTRCPPPTQHLRPHRRHTHFACPSPRPCSF